MSTSKHPTSLIFLSGLLLLVSTATALNVTRLIERDPNFSNFSNYLTQTHIDQEINTRSAVTVLAIPNDKIGDLAGKPADVTKTIMRSHVILDYFDILKLQKLNGKPTIMTTLFQTTGSAIYQQGYLNVTKNSNGEIVFASAVHGAPRDVVLLGSVAAQPFNVSILSVSGHIVTPGVEAYTFSPPPPASAPAPSKAKVQPPAPSTDAPSPSEDDATPPSDAPADAPADSPISKAPTSEPPAADVADAKAPSASSRNLTSFSLGFLVLLASFLATF